MPFGRSIPGYFKTNIQKLAMGIWPWTYGVKSRLPLHYKKCYIMKYMQDPISVHQRDPDSPYIRDQHGQVIRTDVPPIPITYPPESQLGLWGGEGFVVGLRKKQDKQYKPAAPRIWKPMLMKRILYSEILDKWMEITVTKRTLDLIDEAYGFDFYILKTHEVDLKSRLGMQLKREMFQTLNDRSMFPGDQKKQNKIIDKYKQYALPAEEISWVGLSLEEAEHKQAIMEETLLENPRPLKEKYMEDMVLQLQANQLEDEPQKKSTFTLTNPFK